MDDTVSPPDPILIDKQIYMMNIDEIHELVQDMPIEKKQHIRRVYILCPTQDSGSWSHYHKYHKISLSLV